MGVWTCRKMDRSTCHTVGTRASGESHHEADFLDLPLVEIAQNLYYCLSYVLHYQTNYLKYPKFFFFNESGFKRE